MVGLFQKRGKKEFLLLIHEREDLERYSESIKEELNYGDFNYDEINC
jgi:hypothetical protein